jgi:nucleoside-triphosphatase THEP1
MRETTLITGEIAAGKTTALIGKFDAKPIGTAAGFASIRKFSSDDGSFIGYDLKNLATGEEIPFIRLRETYANEFRDPLVYERFVFNRMGFKSGEEIISKTILDASVCDLFIDEIGQLELQGKGFSSILRKALDSGKNVTIGINEKNVDAFAKNYEIDRYKIIACGKSKQKSGRP